MEHDPTEPAAAPSRTCVLVLGMHRSGTSMAAGLLGKLGCDQADHLVPANFANETGYFESHQIAIFNDRLLASCGSDWKDFQKVPEGWFASPHALAAHDEAGALIDSEFGTSALFVLKDPRMCRLMPFWRAVFEAKGIALSVLHVHRSPLEAAASLERRDGLPRGYGHLVWLCNLLEAERATRGLTRHFASYDAILDNWAAEAERMGESFGLGWPRLNDTVAGEIRGFVSRTQRHHEFRPEDVTANRDLSPWLRDTFAIRESWARDGETEEGRDRLDAIRTAYGEGLSAFAGLVRESLTGAQETARLAEEVRAGRETAEAEARHWREAAETRQADREAAEAEARQCREATAALQRQAEAARAEAAARDRARQGELAELRADIEARKIAEAAERRKTKAESETLARTVRTAQEAARGAHRRQVAEICANHARQTAGLEADLGAVREAAQRAELEHAETREHRDLLLSSTSWRVTAPLRRLVTLIRPR